MSTKYNQYEFGDALIAANLKRQSEWLKRQKSGELPKSPVEACWRFDRAEYDRQMKLPPRARRFKA